MVGGCARVVVRRCGVGDPNPELLSIMAGRAHADAVGRVLDVSMLSVPGGFGSVALMLLAGRRLAWEADALPTELLPLGRWPGV